VRGRMLWTLAGVLATAGGLWADQEAARQVADEDVDRAIGELTRYLYARQAGGGHKEAGAWYQYHKEFDPDGHTALATFALLEAGEAATDPRVKKALDKLVTYTPRRKKVYVISVRLMALAHAVGQDRNSRYREPLLKDLKWLLDGAARNGGIWHYDGASRDGDNSCSQFALLALWEAERCLTDAERRRYRIDQVIRAAERSWMQRQCDDGGWNYTGRRGAQFPSNNSMTTAGLASLYVCQDMLQTTSGGWRSDRHKQRAWDYLAKKLTNEFYKRGYVAFCVQRVGMATGRKFIGDMDWYAVGAAEYAKPTARRRGHHSRWSDLVGASFELIFLARGRLPLTFNKLQHGQEDDWNFHSRDLAHLTRFLGLSLERRMRWQVVQITDNVREMLDTPIMLVAGRSAPQFSDEQWAKLREYTLRGGTLLFTPIGGSEAFRDAVRQRLEGLYAAQRKAAGGHYELAPVPAGHALYRNVYVEIPNGPKVAPLCGVSDGTRLLAVLCERDLGRDWQQKNYDTPSGKISHDLGANFFLYATGRNDLHTRMRPVFIGSEREARHTINVAWLQHEGNASTQPFALDYLSEKLRAENRVQLDITRAAAISDEGLRNAHLAWMTGTDAFTLSDAQIAALRRFLSTGGTLFVNAVGGSRQFNRSARQMLRQLFEGTDVQRRTLARDAGLLTGKLGEYRGPRIERLDRTVTWRRAEPTASGEFLELYAKGERTLAIYAPYGIHDTLDGHTAYSAYSFMPRSARDLAANIALYALMDKPDVKLEVPPTPTPTEPATVPSGETDQPADRGPDAPS